MKTKIITHLIAIATGVAAFWALFAIVPIIWVALYGLVVGTWNVYRETQAAAEVASPHVVRGSTRIWRALRQAVNNHRYERTVNRFTR